MSHFYVLALVPTSVPVDEIENFIDANMAPYSEELKVPEYDKKCWCVGNVARKEAREQADKEVASIPTLRDSFNDIRIAILEASGEKPAHPWDVSEDTDEKLQTAWTEHLRPRQEREEAILAAHAKLETADSDCEECNGTGTHKETYNPNSQWDWYRVGGRWDGVAAKIDRKSADNGFNFGAEHQELRNNSISVAEALKTWEPKDAPYAILGPDGKWYAKGKMGWWGMSADKGKNADWREEALAILKAHEGDHIMVGLDCHI